LRGDIFVEEAYGVGAALAAVGYLFNNLRTFSAYFPDVGW
jgi:hypothetical protein